MEDIIMEDTIMEDITMVDIIMEDITMEDTIMVDMEIMASILAVGSTVDSIKVPATVEMVDAVAVDHLEGEVDLMEEVGLTMVEVDLMEEVDLMVEVDLMEEVVPTMGGSPEDFLVFCLVVWEEEVMVAQEETPTLMWFSRTTRAARTRMESSLVKLLISKFSVIRKVNVVCYLSVL